MTICIAVETLNPYAIVVVSDMMLSDDFSSMDSVATKTTSLTDHGSPRWRCMFSGSPSTFDDLEFSIREQVRLQPDASASSQGMQKAVEAAYSSVITRRIETEVLAPFGISRDEFFMTGRQRFGDAYFRDLSAECRRVRLDVDLIVFGFQNGVPDIFTAQKETSTCVSNSQLGFQAVGAGAWAALASMYTRDTLKNAPLSHVVYRACEAKFVSEMARSVGSSTVVEVWGRDGLEAVLIDEVDSIRAEWEAYRDQPISKKALASINEGLTAISRIAKQDERKKPDPQQTTCPAPSKPS